jgi:hypothetical protein
MCFWWKSRYDTRIHVIVIVCEKHRAPVVRLSLRHPRSPRVQFPYRLIQPV